LENPKFLPEAGVNCKSSTTTKYSWITPAT
jgi:hypothetical protein